MKKLRFVNTKKTHDDVREDFKVYERMMIEQQNKEVHAYFNIHEYEKAIYGSMYGTRLFTEIPLD